MTMRIISDGNPDGNSLGQNATDKTGDHGVVSAQIANISTVTAGITADGITTLVDAQNVAINAIIAGLTNKGTVADS